MDMEGKKLIRKFEYYKLVLCHVSEYVQIQLQIILCLKIYSGTVTDNCVCQKTWRYGYR